MSRKTKIATAQNPKPIMAEERNGVIRPRGGKYFRPIYAKFRVSHTARTRHFKKTVKNAERRALRKEIADNEN